MKEFFGWLVAGVVTLAVVLAIGAVLNFYSLSMFQAFAPQWRAAERQVTEQSKSFIDSSNNAFADDIAAWTKANSTAKVLAENGDKVNAKVFADQRDAIMAGICQRLTTMAPGTASRQVTVFVAEHGACGVGE